MPGYFDNDEEDGYGGADFDPSDWGLDDELGKLLDPGMSVPSSGGGGGSGTGTSSGSSLMDLLTGPLGKSIFSGVSGLIGLHEADKMQDMAKDAIKSSDPFGKYRGMYGEQLKQLMMNPGKIMDDPGVRESFELGQQAVNRGMAKQGFLGSGNQAIELQKYGMSFLPDMLQKKEEFLASLAGAGISPNPGPGLNAYANGSQLISDSLGSMGYGMTRAGGASAGTPGGGFSSAGGEAAKIAGAVGGIAGAAGGLADVLGFDLPDFVGSARQFSRGAMGLISGIDQGGISGYGRAALSGYDLAKRFGLNVSPEMNKGVGMAGNALGIYSGIKQGGVKGYGKAAINGISLADKAGWLNGTSLAGTAGKAAGYIAAPIAVWDFASNIEPGDYKGNTLRGAEAGAAVGSVVPVVGTAVGAAVGAVVGAVSSAFGHKESDAERMWKAYKKQALGQGIGSQLSDKNFSFAFKGAWDTNKEAYGRESFGGTRQAWLKDATRLLNKAFTSGKITNKMSSEDINKIILEPWMKGYGAKVNPNVRNMNNDLITELMSGRTLYGNTEKFRGNDNVMGFQLDQKYWKTPTTSAGMGVEEPEDVGLIGTWGVNAPVGTPSGPAPGIMPPDRTPFKPPTHLGPNIQPLPGMQPGNRQRAMMMGAY